jgi:branched-chain amino acid transport system substrate-binding protein
MNRGAWRCRILCALGVAVGTIALARGVEGAATGKGTIKVGFIAPLTGPFAQPGKAMEEGFTMYLDEIGRTVAGRPVELIVEDDEGKPQVTLTKVRKLVEHDGVHMLGGNLLVNAEYALHPVLDGLQVPMVFPQLRTDDVAQRKRAKFGMGTGPSLSQPSHPFGEYAYKVLGYRRVAVVGLDYVFGYEVAGGFQKTFEDLGGQIVQRLWIPLSAIDMAPYTAQIRKDADAVFGVFSGRSAIQFIRQYKEAGLKERLPLIGTGIMTDEQLLPSMGDEVLGIVTTTFYSGTLDTPANQRFAKAVRARTGRAASAFHEGSYTAARWLMEGVRLVQGNVEDRAGLMAALRRVEIVDDPRGPVKLDADGSVIMNIYVRRVERVGGELQNTVIQTYPAVSQFWTYKREEFLKQPVYSRDFPPCQYCR